MYLARMYVSFLASIEPMLLTRACEQGACCNGHSGLCGFGDAFCTEVSKGGNCTSNCDALAECGIGSAPGQENCPLNVCCSKFGFCGTAEDFCTDGW